MTIKPVRNDADHERALSRIEQLWDSPSGTPESDELDVLATLVEAYEREHYPINLPDPVDAIKFRLEQSGKDERSLIGVIGQRTRVYEVMRGRRPLSLNMIRRLHAEFGIPADVLIRQPRELNRMRRSPTRLRRGKLRKSA
jgi:HTH-type transcriptional regulator / antitoxin HigA